MMAKVLNLPIDKNAKPSFGDSQNQWYTPFIAAVEKAGVVKGKERAYSIQLGKLTEFQWPLIVEAYKLDSKVNGTPATKFSDLEKVGVKQKLTF